MDDEELHPKGSSGLFDPGGTGAEPLPPATFQTLFGPRTPLPPEPKQWPNDYPDGLPQHLASRYDAAIRGLVVDSGWEEADAENAMYLTWRTMELEDKPELPEGLGEPSADRRPLSAAQSDTRPNSEAAGAVPWPRTYWISPGRLLAGAYPGDRDPAQATRKLEALRAAGIRHIVNLLDPAQKSHGGVSFLPYADEAMRLGITVAIRPFADLGVPSTQQMEETLDDIDDALSHGRPVYVHCWGGRGRSGTVIGCWLIRHGAAPEAALSELRSLHARQPNDASYPHPETRTQEEFVRGWRESQTQTGRGHAAPGVADRLTGAVWGHLVADALGVPYEFKPSAQIGGVHWGKEGTHHQPPGTWSDDGGLMLALLDSLLHAGFDSDDQGARSLAWYRTAAYKPGALFDIGGATRRALERIERGTPAASAGGEGEGENGNGSLMRILPVALTGVQLSDEDLIGRARNASRVTHAHLRAQLTCALYCLVVRRLLQGEAHRSLALGGAIDAVARSISPNERDELELITAYQPRTGDGYVVDCFWSAWQAFISAERYEEAVIAAIKFGNDTDTTACVAGGLAGAYWGVGSIPGDWLGAMRGRAIVDPLVDELVSAFSTVVLPRAARGGSE